VNANEYMPSGEAWLETYDKISYDEALKPSIIACLEHAKGETFRRGLETIQNISVNSGGQARLTNDTYKLPTCDFYWVITRVVDGNTRMVMNGGLLYHGSHDGFGSGSGPTFAVTLSPTDGWSVHT
jgi:hypothetical protein